MDVQALYGKQIRYSTYTMFSEVTTIFDDLSRGVILDILPFKDSFVYMICETNTPYFRVKIVEENAIKGLVPSWEIDLNHCPLCGSKVFKDMAGLHTITCNKCTFSIGNMDCDWDSVITYWNSFEWKLFLQKLVLTGKWQDIVIKSSYPVEGWVSSELLSLEKYIGDRK